MGGHAKFELVPDLFKFSSGFSRAQVQVIEGMPVPTRKTRRAHGRPCDRGMGYHRWLYLEYKIGIRWVGCQEEFQQDRWCMA